MKDSHVTLRLSDELARAIDRAADNRGIPKSMLVREAVAQYLAGASPPPTKSPMTLDEFITRWRSLPQLSADEAEAFAADIEAARAELLPLRDSWE